MTSAKRKIKRKKSKASQKTPLSPPSGDAQKSIRDQIDLYARMGDECKTCQKPFDKKSKEHATTWTVVVRKKEKKINLYCPECWGRAQDLVREIKKEIGDRDA